jgi:hypothetical protein
MNTNTLYQSVTVTLALVATLLFGAHTTANAQYTFFPNNATINYALPSSSDSAVVGYPNKADWSAHTHRTSPTIKVETGASIVYNYTYNSSVVNMSGGYVSCFLIQDNSIVNVTSDGTIGQVGAYDTGTINVHSGRILAYLTGAYGGTVNVYGGIIGSTNYWAGVATGGTMNIYGGMFYGGSGTSALVYVGIANDPIRGVVTGAATLNMYGARVGSTLAVASVASMTGGFEYTLKGSLRDGTNVTGFKVFVLTGSTFNIH